MVHSKSQFGNQSFLSLGGNFPSTLEMMRKAIFEIAKLVGVGELASSKVYQTTPVSSLPQPPFLNACLRLSTTLAPAILFFHLEEIEVRLGKKKKGKEDPRMIDIDLLLYEDQVVDTEELKIPHPRLYERLFVLRPLSELLSIDLSSFSNPHQEEVIPLSHPLPFQVSL